MATLLVFGAAACFPRPEFAFDLVTYDVPPAMTARGWFEAIHWTPAIEWRVEAITVLREIATTASTGAGEGKRVDVVEPSYLVDARFDLLPAADPGDSVGRHLAIFKRRARAGRFVRPPFLGCRDRPAEIRLVSEGERPPSFYAGSGERRLDWMTYDRDPASDRRLRYHRPCMVDGRIDLSAIDPSALMR